MLAPAPRQRAGRRRRLFSHLAEGDVVHDTLVALDPLQLDGCDLKVGRYGTRDKVMLGCYRLKGQGREIRIG